MNINFRQCGNLTAEIMASSTAFFPPLIVNKFYFNIEIPTNRVLVFSTVAYLCGRVYWIVGKNLHCDNIMNCLRFNFNSQQPTYNDACLIALARKIARIGILHFFAIIPAYLTCFAISEMRMPFVQALSFISSTALTCGGIALIAVCIDNLNKKFITRCTERDLEGVLVEETRGDDSFFD
jgi:hypothetical protein